jgi:heptosyltransferase-2
MNIIVFLPNWIGDVVMSTPMLRALRHHYGQDARIIGVMKPYVAEVLAGSPWIDEQIAYDPRAGNGTWALIRRLRRLAIDLAVILPSSFRHAAVAWLAGAKRRIGSDRNGRRFLLTDPVTLRRRHGELITTAAVDFYLEMAYQAGCPPETPEPELATLPEEDRRADDVLRALGIRKEDQIVLLNPSGGGNSKSAVRAWPAEYFAELAQRIVARYEVQVLVICGPREEQLARQIARLANEPSVHSLADYPVSIGPLKACIRRGRLLVTTDTGPRHLAAGLDVPSVALFGPTNPALSNSPRPGEIQLMLDLPCIHCGKKYCPPGHHACMQKLRVETVYAAVEKQLSDESRFRAAG